MDVVVQVVYLGFSRAFPKVFDSILPVKIWTGEADYKVNGKLVEIPGQTGCDWQYKVYPTTGC